MAYISLKPEDHNPLQLEVDFDIAAPPLDSDIDRIIGKLEEGYKDYSLPTEWQELAKRFRYLINVTLKVEKLKFHDI